MSQLVIRNLHVSIDNKPILKGVNLTVSQGEIHAIMGPNGTGKSTLAYTLMGHPSYQVTAGEVIFKDRISLRPRLTNVPGWDYSWPSNIRSPFPG